MAQEALYAIVADGHSLCRCGMTSLLASIGYSRITTADDLGHLRRALTSSPLTRLATINVDLDGLEGAMGLRRLRLEWPELRIVVVSKTADRDLVLKVISAGVHGFIPEGYSEEEMKSALNAVIQGQIYVPNVISDIGASPIAAIRPKCSAPAGEVELTERQYEVLRLLAAGQSNKEIARSLRISEGTVKVHVNASFRALGVHNRVSAAAVIGNLPANKNRQEPFIPGLVSNGRRNADIIPVEFSTDTAA